VTGWVWLAVPDAVVIGAGPNGLVAANLLADAGLSVVVFEANAQPGGAVRSAPVTVPGFEHDLFSAFYPFAVASPVMRDLGLDAYGLVWRRAPLAVAHPTPEGPAALLSTDPDETAASLDAFAAGDGAAWRRLYRLWQRIESPFMEAFTTPFPPVRAAARLAASVGPRAGARLAHVALLPVRRLAQEWFNGSGGGLLLAGNALHADITPETPGGGAFGWICAPLGSTTASLSPRAAPGASPMRSYAACTRAAAMSTVGSASPRSSSGAAALSGCGSRTGRKSVRRRASSPTPVPRSSTWTCSIAITCRGQCSPTSSASNTTTPRSKSTGRCASRSRGPTRPCGGRARCTSPTAWICSARSRSASSCNASQYGRSSSSASTSRPTRHARRPARTRPGRTATCRSTRAATPTASCAVAGDEEELERFVERMEDEIERLAPGFRDRILGRHIAGPRELERANANLVGGAVNGGTAKLHQQIVFRPVPGLGRSETPVRNLYLGSASAHPGGGCTAPQARTRRAPCSHTGAYRPAP
jgi:phytoene dehydrogenase-like protein